MSAVTVPTTSQVRGYFALQGSPIKGKVTSVQIADFLYGQPATSRALAREVGLDIGKRGRLNPVTVGALVSLVEAQA